jgi:hypothetical protein
MLHSFQCKQTQPVTIPVLLAAAQVLLDLYECSSLLRTAGLGHEVACWLRHYATSRKVAGSRPDKLNELFQFT